MTFDIEQPGVLADYLRQHGHIDADEQPDVRPLSGGVSNRTVWVGRASGEAWVVKQALDKLRVQVDWFSSPQRIHREALGLRWLADLAPEGTIPAPVFEDHEAHLLAMQAIPQPHDNWKTLLLAGQVDPGHVRQFAVLLGTIHRRAHQRRAEVAPVFDDRAFFESLRLEPYYAYSAGQVPAASSFLSRLIEETRATRLSVVHGDYSPKNVLVRDGQLILLDFEVIHWGDPAFDLGFSLAHLLSKAHHVMPQRQLFLDAAAAYWYGYAETLGDVPWRIALEPRAVRQTLGCLMARVAGRSQLEYLSADEKRRQRDIVLDLMTAPPPTVAALVDNFSERLNTYGDD